LIHELGPRHDAPFLKIDCASLPQELVESELFGHERGAFTGAVERKLGRFELSYGGTVVLDEVAALVPGIQSKLMRVLEDHTFERLGGTETLTLDARLIALTNAVLPQLIAAGRFREDLYFRLNVVSIHIPPLRERPADIVPLAELLLARLAAVHNRIGAQFSDDAKQALLAYSWPGNIREMKNVIERSLVFGKNKDGAIGVEDLPENVRASLSGPSMAVSRLKSLEDIEKDAIIGTLEATHYKITKAAQILGISRKTLLDKRKRYGLE
jgi:transcriptional regulator with PAS, ATPase and Fis domain